MATEASGVNYITLDAAKRLGQKIAATTASFLPQGFKDVGWSRGESVQLVDCGKFYLAGLIEGLGTENMVADAMDADNSGNAPSYYFNIGVSNVAVVLNDAATLGVQPLQYFLKIDVCEEEWLTNKQRILRLYKGVAAGCRQARCAWQGGETPSLKDMVEPGQAILAGSSTGIVAPKNRAIRPRIKPGDRIILIRSTGVHDNGLTTARGIAASLPEGYRTFLPNGETFGESLLPATAIYVRAVQVCLNAGVDIHYAVNITGHGLRKLMRAPEPFGYVIEKLPKPQPVFRFIQEQKKFSDEKMYASYNMGDGRRVCLVRPFRPSGIRAHGFERVLPSHGCRLC